MPVKQAKSPSVSADYKESSLDAEIDKHFQEENAVKDIPAAKTKMDSALLAPSKIEVEEKDAYKEERSNISLNTIEEKWSLLINEAAKTRMALASYLRESHLESFSKNTLNIGFSRQNAFHKEIMERKNNIKFVEGLLQKIFNAKIYVNFTLVDKDPPSYISKGIESGNREGAEKNSDKYSSDDGSAYNRNIMDVFGGNIQSDN